MKYVPIVGYFNLTYYTSVYKVIKSWNEWHAGVDRRSFGIKQDFIPVPLIGRLSLFTLQAVKSA